MATNFEHMKPWNAIYEKLTFAEDFLLENDSKEAYIQAMGAIRGSMDVMMKELMRAAGVSDKEIIMIKKKSGKGEDVDMYGRILAAEQLGIITPASAKNLHRIRTLGNDAVHGKTRFVNKGKELLKKEAEELYAKIYRESYLFAKQYMPACQGQGAQAWKRSQIQSGKPNASVRNANVPIQQKPKAGHTSGAVAVAFVLLIAILLFMMLRILGAV